MMCVFKLSLIDMTVKQVNDKIAYNKINTMKVKFVCDFLNLLLSYWQPSQMKNIPVFLTFVRSEGIDKRSSSHGLCICIQSKYTPYLSQTCFYMFNKRCNSSILCSLGGTKKTGMIILSVNFWKVPLDLLKSLLVGSFGRVKMTWQILTSVRKRGMVFKDWLTILYWLEAVTGDLLVACNKLGSSFNYFTPGGVGIKFKGRGGGGVYI